MNINDLGAMAVSSEFKVFNLRGDVQGLYSQRFFLVKFFAENFFILRIKSYSQNNS